MQAWPPVRMAGEAGVMVVVLCCDSTVTMGMLRQMRGVGYDGVTNKDRLLDISTALSSAIYYVPGIDALLAMGISPAIPDYYLTRSFPCVFVPPHCCPA